MFNPNLLNKAFNLIPNSPFQISKFTGTVTQNTLGRDIPEYSDYEDVNGSIQAVDSSMYNQLGLDFQKNYRNVYAPITIYGVDTQKYPDKLKFDDRNWIVIKTLDWTSYNGWSGALVVEDKDYNYDL